MRWKICKVSCVITETACQGVPIQAAMRLSLHKSVAQAMHDYDDAEISENPAVGLME